MASKPTIKTRILIMSDTHEGFQHSLLRHDPYSPDGSFRPPFPKADILIHSGDLTMTGTMAQYRGALALLASMDAELKLVIAGNHDLSLHADYWFRHPNARRIARGGWHPGVAVEAAELWRGEEARKAGVTFLDEGMHSFSLANGAKFSVYASPWQPVFFDWAFNYPLTQDRWNPAHLIVQTPELTRGAEVVPAPRETEPKPIPEGEYADVDVVITHGPPYGHLDGTSSGHKAGCPHLLRALERVRPRLHCFGHIHEAWGAEVIRWRIEGDVSSNGGRFGEEGEIYGSLQSGVQGRQTPMDKDALERRANYLDVSGEGQRPLKVGEETLLINSCIMDLEYEANGSAWLVDIDLPLAQP